MAYRRVHGPLNPYLRQDMAIGQMLTHYISAHSKQGVPAKAVWEVMPFLQEPEMTLEQLQQVWD